MTEDADALAGRLTASGHELQARVYYADTDFSGAVYHARYLEFLERGRSDYLRLIGVHHTDLEAGSTGETLYWVVRRMEIDFRAAARIDDVLTVLTRVAEVGKARIRMAQEIRRGDALLITAAVEAALINAEGKPRRFPTEWAALFAPG
ncbi:tol-pal system-associated acyl-CoA thioesterase [Oricola nitratireducens]|uniref:tol-pal system-associated acyl-CoA thioesterase n=1 Tax=Oricola nitratireducens TaxID=2775868 RepID=UPI0018683CEB|nr:tol-pal system-associated acyl-CoA thioesterase [Oricola nitratireducens]